MSSLLTPAEAAPENLWYMLSSICLLLQLLTLLVVRWSTPNVSSANTVPTMILGGFIMSIAMFSVGFTGIAVWLDVRSIANLQTQGWIVVFWTGSTSGFLFNGAGRLLKFPRSTDSDRL